MNLFRSCTNGTTGIWHRLAGSLGLFAAVFWSSTAVYAAGTSVCLKPGTPAEMEAAAARISNRATARVEEANVTNRWQSTATSGGTNQDGLPVILTWGVVPDGTMVRGQVDVGDADAVSDLRARLTSIYGNDESVWMALIQSSIESWGADSGISFVHEPNDDGSEIDGTSLAPGQVGVRPDIRISGHPIDGDDMVVGYAYFPQSGDMILDTDDDFLADVSMQSINLRNVVAHEIGHAVGLSHVCPINETKLMEPFLSDNLDGPQLDDLLGVTDVYGDALENNDTHLESIDLGISSDESITIMDLSLDGASDVDYFAIPSQSGLGVNVSVSPVGSVYAVEDSDPATGCIGLSGINTNPANYRNLQLEVLEPDGVSSVVFANENGFGGDESISTTLSDGGFVRVFGNFNASPQLYDLTVTLVPEPAGVLLDATGLLALAALARRRRRWFNVR